MRQRSGYIYIYLAALIWGSLGVFARLSGMPPVELSFYRLLMAGVVLSVVLPREKRLATGSLRSYLQNLGAGILFAVDCLLFFHALELTTLSNTVFPYNLQPVFMIMLSRYLPGKELTQGCTLCLFCRSWSFTFVYSLTDFALNRRSTGSAFFPGRLFLPGSCGAHCSKA